MCGCCLCVVTLWWSLGVGFPSVVAFFVDEDVWGRGCAPTCCFLSLGCRIVVAIFVSPARNGPENGQEWTKEAGKSLKGSKTGNGRLVGKRLGYCWEMLVK